MFQKRKVHPPDKRHLNVLSSTQEGSGRDVNCRDTKLERFGKKISTDLDGFKMYGKSFVEVEIYLWSLVLGTVVESFVVYLYADLA